MIMAGTLEDKDWDLLLRRIKAGKCTPFLGAGACHGVLPLGSEIARQWAEEYDYPMPDKYDLTNVAQYVAIQRDPMFPKEEILDNWISGAKAPDFDAEDEPHGVLADLPLPVYLTTNYDDFMVRALSRQGKKPRRELCRWNKYLKGRASVFDTASGYHPDPSNPVVFHLHGHDEVPESLVLSGDDYLDFLVNIWRDQALLPSRIQEAISGSSLLFIGYSLQDWSFRVLFRGLVMAYERTLRRINVSVQLLPVAKDLPEEAKAQVQDYLDSYFDEMEIRIYWGTARKFAGELRRRWTKYLGQ
jgi:hypothetical protein